MRRSHRISALSVVMLLGACASHPSAPRDEAYASYWQCASQAIRPYANDHGLTAREAAMRAQAGCNLSYKQYRSAQVGHVRSQVPSRDYAMADSLGAQAALDQRRRVTRALTGYVHRIRSERN